MYAFGGGSGKKNYTSPCASGSATLFTTTSVAEPEFQLAALNWAQPVFNIILIKPKRYFHI
jgi:hypothetical protein